MTITNGASPTVLAGDLSNDGADTLLAGAPYVATIRLQGSSDMLFHRYSCDEVETKGKAAKGSAAKKTDNLEAYVWRNADNELCLPGQYVVGSLTDPKNGAAKYRQDPRSPRKSALDLFKAGVVPLTALAPILVDGSPVTEWEYVDRRRALVQRAAVIRERPAFRAGWEAEVQLQVLSPEYIDQFMLLDTLITAGRLVGIADFRPTYGRFNIVDFKIGLD